MRFSLLLALSTLLLNLSLSWQVIAAQPENNITVTVADQDFGVSRFPARGDHLVLWIGSGGPGNQARVQEVAAALAGRGTEVWYIDILDSLFMTRSHNSMRSLDGHYIAGLIAAAHKRTGKKIVLMAKGFADIPLLRGARLWQKHFFADLKSKQPAYLSGAILISPELHSKTVALGLKPVYTPISMASNVPIAIFQSGKRGNRWQLKQTIKNLEHGGSRVQSKVFEGVTGVFYKEDTAPATLAALKALPTDLVAAIRYLDMQPMPDKVLPLRKISSNPYEGREISLARYRGNPNPHGIDLLDTDDKPFIKKNFRGQLTLINFWASWCGPCVKEIPSLNKLRNEMQGKPFELISINYAEDKQQINDFMKKVAVHYPVLLDKDGETAKQWGVYVFPATFVIGPDGKIIYGVNGGLYWDDPGVIKKLDHLMAGIKP